MKKLFLCLMSLFLAVMLAACTSENQVLDGEDNDANIEENTGKLVSGSYLFTDYNQLTDFYSIFIENNAERFIIPNFDDEQETIYAFVCGGIDAEIISNKKFNYDFPSPMFRIEINDIYLDCYDVSSYISSIKNFTCIEIIDSKENAKRKDIYVDDYLIASVTYTDELSVDVSQLILNNFVEVIENVF